MIYIRYWPSKVYTCSHLLLKVRGGGNGTMTSSRLNTALSYVSIRSWNRICDYSLTDPMSYHWATLETPVISSAVFAIKDLTQLCTRFLNGVVKKFGIGPPSLGLLQYPLSKVKRCWADRKMKNRLELALWLILTNVRVHSTSAFLLDSWIKLYLQRRISWQFAWTNAAMNWTQVTSPAKSVGEPVDP